MCRFVIYLGPPIPLSHLTTLPTHSLIHQSYKAREREEPLNGDGFGVAWYAPELSPEPALFRDVTPAWNNENLRCLAQVTRSRTILAHVRAATQGSVLQTNCHPFSAGPLAFMHNG
ncbi:MAG: class II glutamine amidotransferase, partial [Myxococcota bacterium]